MKIRTWMVIAAAGGAYALYQKNKTNQWPWETGLSALLGYEKWTINVYSNSSATPQNVSSATNENDARAIGRSAKAACPTCRVEVLGPNGQAAVITGAELSGY